MVARPRRACRRALGDVMDWGRCHAVAVVGGAFSCPDSLRLARSIEDCKTGHF